MIKNKVYPRVVEAFKNGKLQEPFTNNDFRKACPGFGRGTYNAFLWKHRMGNPKNNTELFIKVSPGKFKLVRPFKYSLDG